MKPIVKQEFQLPSGELAVRATSKDIPTFNRRVFGRIGKILGDEIANKTVIPGLNAYNSGQYKEARGYFEQAIALVPPIAEELNPHLIICRRVLSIEKDYDDGIYEGELDRWQQSLFRWFLAKPVSENSV